MKLELQGQCEDCGGYLKSRRIFADYCPVCTPFRALLLGAVFWGAVITLALSLFLYLVLGMAYGLKFPFPLPPLPPLLLVGMALCWVWASFLYLRVLGVVGGAYGGGYFGGGNGGGGNGGGGNGGG